MVNNPLRIERNVCITQGQTATPIASAAGIRAISSASDPSMAKGQLSEARAAVASHLIAAGQAISCSNSIDDVIATLMFWDRDQVSTCFGDLVAPHRKSLAQSGKT